MRIDALLSAGGVRSFEFFPPKTDKEERTLKGTLETLAPLSPSFVSVTYRGGAASRQRTFDLVQRIQRDFQLTAMAHLICVGHTATELREILATYQREGVENVMALGGDIPDDPAFDRGDYRFAADLVGVARECGEFAIGVAAHPLGHPRSPSRTSDRRYLAEKLRVADFAVTQFFFEAGEWSGLVEDLSLLGVNKPVLPGVLALTDLGAVNRMTQMGGVVPRSLIERLERADSRGGPSAVREEGIVAATELCRELLRRGAPGLHFYTMNRSATTLEIYHQLGE